MTPDEHKQLQDRITKAGELAQRIETLKAEIRWINAMRTFVVNSNGCAAADIRGSDTRPELADVCARDIGKFLNTDDINKLHTSIREAVLAGVRAKLLPLEQEYAAL